MSYTIKNTNKSYNGRVVRVGNNLYTTKSGALEGKSQLLKENIDGVASDEKLKPKNQSKLTDVVTTFRVGDGSKFGRRNRTYYYSDGKPVPLRTPLHHHTITPEGRLSNFMTQHTMDGNEQDVFIRRPSDKRKTTQTRSTYVTTRRTSIEDSGATRTSRTTSTPTPRTGGSGGSGGSGGGTGGGGGY